MFFLKSRMLHWALIVALISGMSVVGLHNITGQRKLVDYLPLNVIFYFLKLFIY